MKSHVEFRVIDWGKEWRTHEQITAYESAQARRLEPDLKYVNDPEPLRTWDQITADEAGIDRFRPL